MLGVGEDQSVLIDPIEAADGIVRLGLNASNDFLGLPVHDNQHDLAIELRSGRNTLARRGERNIEVVTVLQEIFKRLGVGLRSHGGDCKNNKEKGSNITPV
ncbi:MAG TPA: hypothetical protein DEX20_08530 [Halieaceae bacterium]|nr:hypothetical protein [Halieaceae bacterium]